MADFDSSAVALGPPEDLTSGCVEEAAFCSVVLTTGAFSVVDCLSSSFFSDTGGADDAGTEGGGAEDTNSVTAAGEVGVAGRWASDFGRSALLGATISWLGAGCVEGAAGSVDGTNGGAEDAGGGVEGSGAGCEAGCDGGCEFTGGGDGDGSAAGEGWGLGEG